MKTLIVVDKKGSAIDIMSEGLLPYLKHWGAEVVAVHPKRPDEAQIQVFKEKMQQADVIDFQYWKTAEMLIGLFPELRLKKKLLTHHNPYDLQQMDWKHYDKVIVLNEYQAEHLKTATLIPHTIDLDFWTFNREYTKDKIVLMVAGRIEGKKGIQEVANVCQELGYHFILVGSISKPDYFKEFADKVDFREKISNEELKDIYYKSAVHVCNSVDDFESGTLPILEAMATGVPVLTRAIGHVPETNNGKNMVIRKGKPDDVEDLKKELKSLMEDEERRIKIRNEAWNSVKVRSNVRRARDYSRLYWKALTDEPLVSVIIPTFNRVEMLSKVIAEYTKQGHSAIEIVVCDDGSTDGTQEFVEKIRGQVKFPIKYINTGDTDGYGLAKARNLGVIEAEGEYLLFSDVRLVPDLRAVQEFMDHAQKEKTWYFGYKGFAKKTFVENFSFIKRQEFIEAGMCNERITKYGGMSQELRERFKAQGFRFEFIAEAKCEAQAKGSGRSKKEDIIEMKNILYKMGLG